MSKEFVLDLLATEHMQSRHVLVWPILAAWSVLTGHPAVLFCFALAVNYAIHELHRQDLIATMQREIRDED